MTTTDLQLPDGYHWLEVSEIRKETRNSSSITFHVPEDLRDHYRFASGQYVYLLHAHEGRWARRPYSLCVPPDRGVWTICSRAMPHGLVSSYLNRELKVGDRLPVRAAQGRFVLPVEADRARQIVGFTSASGITPMIAILEELLEREPGTYVHLFFANAQANDITFRDRLADLKDRHLQRLALHHLLGDPDDQAESVDDHDSLLEGALTTERVTAICGGMFDLDRVDHFLICGPGEMVTTTVKALRSLGVPRERYVMESFGSPNIADHEPVKHPTSDNVPTSCKATLIVAGERRQVTIEAGQSVLDAALDAAMDMPFACKGGVCCTCKARLTAGKVKMAVNFGLEADEMAAGYVLTCQARPETETITLEY